MKKRQVIILRMMFSKAYMQEFSLSMIKHEKICRYPGTDSSKSPVFSRTEMFERNSEEENEMKSLVPSAYIWR
jgi:hypothetical protein